MNYKEEAIIRLEECIADCTSGEDDIYKLAFATAITALRKQIPQKVSDIEHFGRCPECDGEFNSELLNEYNIVFCPWCGQALDWTEN